MSLPTEPQSWSRDGFFISTDKSLLSIAAINAAFDADFMYWAKAFPEDILQLTIDNSFCFGLYKTIEPENESTANTRSQIGFARLITDKVTFAYLTDLYVIPEYQGFGLGGWLIDCVDGLLDPLPHLRWAMLRTSQEKSKESYRKRMGMVVLDPRDESHGAVTMGKKGKASRA